MLKRVLANTMAKKATIFAGMFALTCILMGNKLHSLSDEQSFINWIIMPVGGQAVVETDPEKFTPASEFAFPFSGEYPSVGDSPLQARPLIEIEIAKPEGFVYTEQIPLSIELQKYTYNACVEKNLEYELVLALMWRESRFQVDAVGYNTNGTKDSGIMQINDVNRGWLREEHGIVDLMDPYQNIDAGTTMLSDFVRRYGVHDALMAYQYGEQGMFDKLSQGVVTNDQIAVLIQKREDFRSILQNT